AKDKPASRGADASDARDEPQGAGAQAAPRSDGKAANATGDGAAPHAGVIDPLQWWGSLTQQFQEIATSAMRDAGQGTALDAARNLASGMADQTLKAASQMAGAAASSMAGAKKTAAAKDASGRASKSPASGKTAAGKKSASRSTAKTAAKAPRGA
ncbi:MAG TPA: hypothetical protein VLJ86_25775, partial [Ramlibacter sp.]|nr:hypothetical protein [Ramlibacter sp.]